MNSVFSSQQANIPNHRRYTGFGVYGKEAFGTFHNYYYQESLLRNITKKYSGDLSKMIKNNNEKELEICLGWSSSLTLKNKFVKTNVVEFIRYSPLYFKSVIEDIYKKKISEKKIVQEPKEINSSKRKKDVFFEQYLSYRSLPFIVGSGLLLPSFFFKKKLRIKIPLTLLVAFFGGGAFWMWQQKKIKEVKENNNLKDFIMEREIKESEILITEEEVQKYYPEKLIEEGVKDGSYEFKNDVIKTLVMDSQQIYNRIGEQVKQEEANKKEELLRQAEEKKNAEQADLEHTIKTNLDQKNRKALNQELDKIAKVCSGMSTMYNQSVDSIKIEEKNEEKKSLIKNIFDLIYISLKTEYFDEDVDSTSKIKIPQCQYTILFNEGGELAISGVYEKIATYNVVINKKIDSKQDIEKEDNAEIIRLSSNGFNHEGFSQRGGKDTDARKYFYQLPFIIKNENELNIDSSNKLFNLILSCKYPTIDYNEKFE